MTSEPRVAMVDQSRAELLCSILSLHRYFKATYFSTVCIQNISFPHPVFADSLSFMFVNNFVLRERCLVIALCRCQAFYECSFVLPVISYSI